MFKFAKLATAVVALSLLCVTWAGAYSRDFQFANNTTYHVTSLAFKDIGTSTWVTATGTAVDPQDIIDVKFPNAGPCSLQVRATFSDHSAVTWDEPLNFCVIRKAVLMMNSDDSLYINSDG